MKDSHIKIIKIIVLCILLSLCIGLEVVYRQPLFNKTLDIVPKWQSNSNNSTTNFYKIWTDLGLGPSLSAWGAIIFLWFPLTKSYTFLTALIYSFYFNNLFKIIYGNPRPFWVDPSVFMTCNAGFGNPSGHAMCSVSVFLTFWHLITDEQWFKKTKFGLATRIGLLLLFIAICLLIIVSRVYFGAHSIDQVLYGATLGLIIYYVTIFILEFHTMDAKKFFTLFSTIFYLVLFSSLYICLIILGMLVWKFKNNHQGLWEPIINKLCPSQLVYRSFNMDGLFGLLSVTGIIGGHYGLVFLFHITKEKFKDKEEEINNWYRVGLINTLYKILLGIAFASPLVLVVAISSKASIPVIYIFKVTVPYLVGLFSLLGLYPYAFIRLKIANKEIYEQQIQMSNLKLDENKDLSKSNNVLVIRNNNNQQV